MNETIEQIRQDIEHQLREMIEIQKGIIEVQEERLKVQQRIIKVQEDSIGILDKLVDYSFMEKYKELKYRQEADWSLKQTIGEA